MAWHPTQKIFLEAQVTKIQDQSQYTVGKSLIHFNIDPPSSKKIYSSNKYLSNGLFELLFFLFQDYSDNDTYWEKVHNKQRTWDFFQYRLQMRKKFLKRLKRRKLMNKDILGFSRMCCLSLFLLPSHFAIELPEELNINHQQGLLLSAHQVDLVSHKGQSLGI